MTRRRRSGPPSRRSRSRRACVRTAWRSRRSTTPGRARHSHSTGRRTRTTGRGPRRAHRRRRDARSAALGCRPSHRAHGRSSSTGTRGPTPIRPTSTRCGTRATQRPLRRPGDERRVSARDGPPSSTAAVGASVPVSAASSCIAGVGLPSQRDDRGRGGDHAHRPGDGLGAFGCPTEPVERVRSPRRHRRDEVDLRGGAGFGDERRRDVVAEHPDVLGT